VSFNTWDWIVIPVNWKWPFNGCMKEISYKNVLGRAYAKIQYRQHCPCQPIIKIYMVLPPPFHVCIPFIFKKKFDPPLTEYILLCKWNWGHKGGTSSYIIQRFCS